MNALETVAAVLAGHARARHMGVHTRDVIVAKAPQVAEVHTQADEDAWLALVCAVANVSGVSAEVTAERVALFARTKSEVYGALPSLSSLLEEA